MVIHHIPQEIVDTYLKERSRTVLTGDQTWLPSLSVFGHSRFLKASSPLFTHYHNETIEFVLVLDGVQSYIIDDTVYTVNSGEVFVSYPNELHGTGISPQHVGEILWFQINLSSAHNFLGLGEQWGAHLYTKLSNLKLRKFTTEPTLAKQFLKSLTYISSDLIDDKLKGGSLFIHCLSSLISKQSDSMPPISDEIGASLLYIKENLTEIDSLDEIAGVAALSVSRFSHKFKTEVGTPPREYINLLKIERSKQLLTTTLQSVTDIAFNLSFTSSDYFSRVFKKYTGSTPLEYRKAYNTSALK